MSQKDAEDSLGPSGRALFDDITGRFALDQGERLLLLNAARTADRLDALDAEVTRDGVTVETVQGLRAHPALVEQRQQAVTLARLVSALRVPEDEAGDDGEAVQRPQRRAGVRGPYRLRVAQ